MKNPGKQNYKYTLIGYKHFTSLKLKTNISFQFFPLLHFKNTKNLSRASLLQHRLRRCPFFSIPVLESGLICQKVFCERKVNKGFAQKHKAGVAESRMRKDLLILRRNKGECYTQPCVTWALIQRQLSKKGHGEWRGSGFKNVR